MSLDITTIENYVEENATTIKAKMVSGETSARHWTTQTGVKAPTSINTLSTDATFQDGSVAGWTPEGTTILSQRILTPGDVKVQEAINPKDINKSYLSNLVKNGSYEDSIPFEEVYVNAKLDAINKNTEKALYQGDKDSSDVNLNKFDGLLKILSNETNVVEGNTGGSTEINKENVVGIIDDMYAALPTDILEAEDLKLAVGYDVARLYVAKHKDLDLRNYDAIKGKFEFQVPGTNVTLFATSGLNGTSQMIMASESNVTIGVDLENDEEMFKLFYSQDDFVVKYHANFKKAVQVAFPEQVVLFTLSA